jgi:Ca-activated chloride channel family protein
MQPSLRFDRSVIAVQVEDEVHLLVELEAPEAPQVQRPPIDVVVVIDRSGSMHGDPLRSVIEATCGLLRLAGPNDRVGVVAFDGQVDVVLPLRHHDADVAARTVRQLRSRGSTNLSGGWLKALEMLHGAARPDALTRIVLLTDGQANLGVTDQDRLASMTLSAASKGVSTSCIGFGDGYSEQLLAAMASAGRGNDYWCAGPDQAAAVFTAEFDGLSSVVAQNLSVELRPSVEVIELGVLNEFPITEVAGGVQVALGDAYGGERRRVVAKLRLAPQAATGPLQVGEVIIRWAAVGDVPALHSLTIPVMIGVDTDPDSAPADPEVVEQVLVLQAAREQTEAHEAIARGDFEQASMKLGSAADLLGGTNGHELRARELRLEARRLEDRDWDESSNKRLYSAGRAMSRGRASRFEATDVDSEDQS